MKVNISLEKLLETGAHFGHQSRRWNPKMEPYIYGEEDGVHVFDLIKTKDELEKVLEFLSESVKNGKKIILVGTKKQVKDKVMEVARETGQFFVNERWLGGTLTNFEMIKKSLTKLKKMKEEKEAGEFSIYTKKERLLLDREITRLERFFGGLQGLSEKPDILIIIDLKKEKGAATEAKRLGITTIGIADTNSDPDLVDYAIPMNDDATKALEYVLDLIKDAMVMGNKSNKAKEEKKVEDVKKEE